MLYYYREEDGDGDEIFGDGVGKKIVEQAVGKDDFQWSVFLVAGVWRMCTLS